MGQQQSKGELLFQQVNYGNIEGIKSLHSEGASLEWVDQDGKTPLIVACMNPELYNVAKTLIELGANVNAYRPARFAGTPLHHAAKRGLEQTVLLLLSHGANALLMNDDCQTPLDIARIKGYGNVVRAIESHLCLFSGWLRELYGPGFLELLAPQFLSRTVWVVVVPCGSRNPSKPIRLELAIYASIQDAKPRTLIALWKANLEEPNFNQPDPTVVISSVANKSSRVKLAAANEGDKQFLQLFCNACKGITQARQPAVLATAPTPPPAIHNVEEELTTAITASLHLGPTKNPKHQEEAGPSGVTPAQHAPSEAGPSGTSPLQHAPSAPDIEDAIIDDSPIQYPSIDSDPIDFSAPVSGEKDGSCVICLDAPVEGACIPCGHMAGCMMCLNEIKGKNWGCPVCRANIEQVVRLYTV